MNLRQYALMKLAEECNEVAQRALKMAQFGADEIQPGQPYSNAQRLRTELLDLHMWENQLVRDDAIVRINALDVLAHTGAKRATVMNMVTLSHSLGTLQPEPGEIIHE